MLKVRIARAFEGPRHDRLAKIWDCIAEYYPKRLRLEVTPNLGPNRLSHAQVFQKMWDEECENDDSRFVLLTEYDFLPLPMMTQLHKFMEAEEVPCFACRYQTRNPTTLQLRNHGDLAAGWFVLLDKKRCPKGLVFDGKPDPCNQLSKQVDMWLAKGQDGYPLHYGIDYKFGTHLFWSRHYHDDPDQVIAGVRLGDMQEKVDRTISRWISGQSSRFRGLLRRRCPEVAHAPAL